MPELIEVEIYRRQAVGAIGRPIVGLEIPNSSYAKGDAGVDVLTARVVGSFVVQVRRIGKLLLLDLDCVSDGDGCASVALGLRFGMTGRLVVDGEAAINELLYSKSNPDGRHDRFTMTFEDGGSLVVVDPRRFGGVELDPDVDRLGPDAATISLAHLRLALGSGTAAVKSRMLDQKRLAGVGNLIADETFWRCGIDPRRPAKSLDEFEVVRLGGALRSTIASLQRRGGSHMGDLQDERHVGGLCPRDGARLTRSVVGGRTTYWCPVHQA